MHVGAAFFVNIGLVGTVESAVRQDQIALGGRARAEDSVAAEPAILQRNGGSLRSPAAGAADRAARVIFQIAIEQGRPCCGVDIKTAIAIQHDGAFDGFELRARIERDNAVVIFSNIAVFKLSTASGKNTESGSIVMEAASTNGRVNRDSIALAKDYSGDT